MGLDRFGGWQTLAASAERLGGWEPSRVYWARHRRGYRIAEAPFAFLIPVVVSGLFLLSITNLAFNRSVGFAVGFPLLGIGLSFLGLGLALFSRLPERWGLISANCLFLMMSFCSIIAPN